jgi:hypothetical protein
MNFHKFQTRRPTRQEAHRETSAGLFPEDGATKHSRYPAHVFSKKKISDEAEPATHCRRNETDTVLISLFGLLWPAKKLSTWFERKGKFYGMRGNLSFLYNITTQPKNNYPCKSHWDLERPEPGNIEPNGSRIPELSSRLGF